MITNRGNSLPHRTDNHSLRPSRAPWDPTLHADHHDRGLFPILTNRTLPTMAQKETLRMERHYDQENAGATSVDIMSLCGGNEGDIDLKRSGSEFSKDCDFVSMEENLIDSSSSLTDSDEDWNMQSADTSIDVPWFMDGELVDGSVELGGQPMCFPYAQLCFDPESKTLVTLMEIHLASTVGRLSKRLCMIHTQGNEKKAADPNLSRTDSTVSIHSDDEAFPVFPTFPYSMPDSPKKKERFDEPIVLSSIEAQETWLEETDLGLYLLHECQDPWQFADKAHGGCTEALKKLLAASKALVYFRARTGQEYFGDWKVSHEPFSRLSYTFLHEI